MVEDDLDPVSADPAFAEVTAVADEVKIPRKQRRSFKDAPPLQKPTPGERENSAMALRMSEQAVERSRAAQTANQTYKADSVSYVECHDSTCLGPAIWIYGDPTRTPLADWETSYKPRNAEWPNGVIPWCQCCQARGRRVTIKGIWKNGHTKATDEGQVFMGRGIKTNPRYVRTLTEAEAREFWKSKE
jgi:hypothetical protein